MARRFLYDASSPPPSLSPLHLSQYSLPSSSRLPKFMIGAVAGVILMSTATYYFCRWFFFKRCCNHGASQDFDEESASAQGNSNHHRNSSVGTSTEDDLQARATKALVQRLGSKIATAIPSMSYADLVQLRSCSDDKAFGKEDVESEVCAVCLTEFSRNPGSARIKVLPKCGHAFHSKCIDLWLSTRASCPICRASLFVMFSNQVSPLEACCPLPNEIHAQDQQQQQQLHFPQSPEHPDQSSENPDQSPETPDQSPETPDQSSEDPELQSVPPGNQQQDPLAHRSSDSHSV